MTIPEPLFLTGENLAYTEEAETIPARLTSHARTMNQGVYQVAESFYVAVGYGQANMTMVVGDDGVLLIDCLETEERARRALADLRRVSDKPIRALIYSHSHPDHISGVRAILDKAAVDRGEVEIYAHERLLTGILGNPTLGIVPPVRLAYTFGHDLEPGPEGWVETGLGIQFTVGTSGFIPPTAVFQGTLDIQIAGIRVQLREAPSESDDEIVMWFPDHGVLHAADVIQGESFPNLYALRGAVRDIWQWIRAIDLLREYDAEALIIGHGRPLIGRAEVADMLLTYRDALQYIHDQTVRYMARGLTPDELVEVVSELPERMRDHPWLGEFYGSVEQSVRQIYHNAFGWFEGDPTAIDPLPRAALSARYVTAMGGREAVVGIAERAYAEGDFRWVAEVLTHVLRQDSADQQARRLKADALRQLGYQAVNPIWRNNYLMAAKEIDGTLDRSALLDVVRAMRNPDVAANMPIPLLLRGLATRLDASQSAGVEQSVTFRCTDTARNYGLVIRSEVADVLGEGSAGAAVEIRTTEPALRQLLTGQIAWMDAIEGGQASLDNGTTEELEGIWGLFDPPPGDLPAIALR